jgi:hypothetical protein
MPDTEEAASGTNRWSNLKSKQRKDPSATLDRSALVTGSEVIHPKEILDLSCLPKRKEPKYISLVHVTLRVPSGTVKDLVMDLLFMGLDTIWLEDKSLCFAHPKDSGQIAKEHQDMPAKFQNEDWAKFNQGITRFKNDIKSGRKRIYTLSMWLGSIKPPQQILEACALEWEEEQSNSGLVKITYKWMQSLHTSRSLMLIGVPTDVDPEALQIKNAQKNGKSMPEDASPESVQVWDNCQGPKIRPVKRLHQEHTLCGMVR